MHIYGEKQWIYHAYDIRHYITAGLHTVFRTDLHKAVPYVNPVRLDLVRHSVQIMPLVLVFATIHHQNNKVNTKTCP